MIGVSVCRMRVRNLHKGEQGQQRQAYKSHRKGAWPCAASLLESGVEFGKHSPALKNTQIWMRLPHQGHRSRLQFHKGRRQTPQARNRLNYGPMARYLHSRYLLAVSLATVLAGPAIAIAQEHKPLQAQPGVPGMSSNHRLILKDGSYQMVRQYEIVGDRVRYLSQERGEWEEMPANLVDWDATRRWEQDHAAGADNSPAMKEAADLDKEEAAERSDEKARMPEVATGLELPDQDGVFVLDTFQGTPELVELLPIDLSLNQRNKHGLSTLNPLAGERASIEIEGAHAKVHLHVNQPEIYLSLDGNDHPLTTHALTVQTVQVPGRTNRKHGAQSSSSGFAIVRVDERQRVRIVGGIHVSPTGTVTQSEDVIPAKAEVLPGKHWLKLTPAEPLKIGEYALVEILSPSDINQTVWDFNVNPTLGDNPSALGPIVSGQTQQP